MHKFKDITGQKFGDRTVISLSHQNKVSGNYYWFVQCSCGRKDIVSYTRLKQKQKCLKCSGRINGRKGLYSQSKNLPCYFIRCGDYVKIGSSKDPKRRLKDMETNNPYELELLFVDYENSEEYWHKKLKNCHYKGEWFLYKEVCEMVDIGG